MKKQKDKTKQKESWETRLGVVSNVYCGCGSQVVEIDGKEADDKMLKMFIKKQLTKAKVEGAEEAVRGFVEFCWNGTEIDSYLISKRKEYLIDPKVKKGTFELRGWHEDSDIEWGKKGSYELKQAYGEGDVTV